MADPLFFFGSGASANFGIPTMKEMVPLFKEELVKRSGSESEEEIQLYTEVESVLRNDFDRVDLEAVFSVIDGIAGGLTPHELGYLSTFFARRTKDSSLFEPPVDSLRNAARRLLGKFEGFVKRVCWVDPGKLDEITETYLSFFNEIGQKGFANANFTYKGQNRWYNSEREMFTTNYDNVLEVFWRNGIGEIELNTGFGEDIRTRLQVMTPQFFLQTNKLKLVKLHGSITWWVEEGTDKIVEKEQPPNEEYIPQKYKGQVMLYPIQQKDTFLSPYVDMYYSLKQGLIRSSRWLVVGYSFADDIIRALFAQSSKPQTKLVLVHPDENVYRKIQGEPGWKGRLYHVTKRFGESSTNTAVTEAFRA